jgi:hypothetical protein
VETVQWAAPAGGGTVALQHSGDPVGGPLLGHAFGPYGTKKGEELTGPVVGFGPLG